MADVLEYKCPNCGGKIEYLPGGQTLVCPYCDSQFDIDKIKEFEIGDESEQNSDEHWDASKSEAWSYDEADGLRRYICQSCGGEVVGDEALGATQCPFCGNPIIIADQFGETLKPDFVLPFKLDKNGAKRALGEFCKGKLLLPKQFTSDNHIDEVQGVYVPFWLFSAECSGKMTFKTTRVRRWSDSKYNYTETNHYLVRRDGSMLFERVPVDASKKMDDALMDTLEPFNYAEMVDFKTAYLSGFLADRYDVTSDECSPRAKDRMVRSAEQQLTSTVVGYSSVIPQSRRFGFSSGVVKYVLLPVWMLGTTYKGERYIFAVNGQSGKVAGRLPVDYKRFFKWLGIFTLAIAAVAYPIALAIGGAL